MQKHIKSYTLGQAVIKWGLFLQTLLDFTIVAFSIFAAIKLINYLKGEQEEASKKSDEIVLLTEIRDLLKQNMKA